MGADLIMAHCPWPTDPDGKPCNAGVELVQVMARKLLGKLEHLDQNAQMELNDAFYYWNIAPDVDDSTDALRGFRMDSDKVFDIADTCFGYAYRRDLTTILVRGRLELITGGLSWGDVPTDAFDPVAFVRSLLDDEEFENVVT